jgi:predicted Zn-dependent protease with MMP-like domain
MNKAPNAWTDRVAPTLEDFAFIAESVFLTLPQTFRDLVGSVTFAVADFAEDGDLEELEIESPYDLLGLFSGVGMAQAAAAAETGMLPNRILLYRRPILDYWAEHDETLGAVVGHVLVHEIGHHFGLSDADMEAIEAAAG